MKARDIEKWRIELRGDPFKTLIKEFELFRDVILGLNITSGQEEMAHKAFIAGSIVMMRIVSQIAEDFESEEQAMLALEDLRLKLTKQVEEFISEYQ